MNQYWYPQRRHSLEHTSYINVYNIVLCTGKMRWQLTHHRGSRKSSAVPPPPSPHRPSPAPMTFDRNSRAHSCLVLDCSEYSTNIIHTIIIIKNNTRLVPIQSVYIVRIVTSPCTVSYSSVLVTACNTRI